jgi:hypothetical protein
MEFETDLAAANALRGGLAYVTTPAIRQLAKVTLATAGVSGYLVDQNNRCFNGYPVAASIQVPAQHLLFGNFTEVFLGLWGILEISSEGITLGDSGGLTVRAFQDVDVAVRHAASFSLAIDV